MWGKINSLQLSWQQALISPLSFKKKISRKPIDVSPHIFSSPWFSFFFLWQNRHHLCECNPVFDHSSAVSENHRTSKCSFNWVTSQRLANRFHMLLDCPPLYASSAFFLHSSFWAACLRENNYIWSVVKWPRSCCFADWQYLMQIDGSLLWKSPRLTIHRVLPTIAVWVKTQAPLCIFTLSFSQNCWY